MNDFQIALASLVKSKINKILEGFDYSDYPADYDAPMPRWPFGSLPNHLQGVAGHIEALNLSLPKEQRVQYRTRPLGQVCSPKFDEEADKIVKQLESLA